MSPQHTSLKQKVDDHSQHHPGEFPCAKIVALQNDLDKVEQDLADKTEELLVLQRSYNRLKKEFDLKVMIEDNGLRCSHMHGIPDKRSMLVRSSIRRLP